MRDATVSTVLLFAWCSLLLLCVAGILFGIFAPGGARTGALGLFKRHTRFLARYRWMIIPGVIGVSIIAGIAGQVSEQCETKARSVPATNEGATQPVIGSTQAGGADGQATTPPYGQGWLGRSIDLLYSSVREMTSEGEPGPEDAVGTRMARVGGLAAILLLALELIVQLFNEPVQRFRLRRQRGHLVICGLGQVGRELVKSVTASPKGTDPKGKIVRPVVVIESDPLNRAIGWARDRGALVWIGDMSRKSTLDLVRAPRASHVFFVAGRDEQNLEGIANLTKMINAAKQSAIATAGPRVPFSGTSPGAVPQILVHLDKVELGAMCQQAVDLVATERGESYLKPVIRAFNVLERSVAELFDTEILKHRPVNPANPNDTSRVMHYVIAGFGPVGQRIALMMAELSHFENRKRSRVTIIHHPRERYEVEMFRALYPKFFPTSGYLRTVTGPDDDLHYYDPSAAENAWTPNSRLDHWAFGVHVDEAQVERRKGVAFVCNGGFIESAADITSDAMVTQIQRLCRDPMTHAVVFICDANDENNCTQAKELLEELRSRRGASKDSLAHPLSDNVLICPYVNRLPTLKEVLVRDRSRGLIPFGDASTICTFDRLSVDILRPLAEAIIRAYDASLQAPTSPQANAKGAPSGDAKPVDVMGSAGEPSERHSTQKGGFDNLDAWQQRSNLMAAAHLSAKLSVFGLRLYPSTHPSAAQAARPDLKGDARLKELVGLKSAIAILTDATAPRASGEDGALKAKLVSIQVAAEIEHNRWMAERLLADWGYGEKTTPENRRRLTFVHWDRVPSTEKRKDCDQVFAILEQLKSNTELRDYVSIELAQDDDIVGRNMPDQAEHEVKG